MLCEFINSRLIHGFCQRRFFHRVLSLQFYSQIFVITDLFTDFYQFRLIHKYFPSQCYWGMFHCRPNHAFCHRRLHRTNNSWCSLIQAIKWENTPSSICGQWKPWPTVPISAVWAIDGLICPPAWNRLSCYHGWKFKISKILNFWKSNLKTCSMPISIIKFKFKWSIVFR